MAFLAVAPGQDIRAVLLGDAETRAQLLSSEPKRYAPLLIAALSDSDAGIRKLGATGIREMDPIGESVRDENAVDEELRKTLVNPLAKACRDEIAGVRNEAMKTLLHLLRNRNWGHHGEPWTDPKECIALAELGEPVLPTIKAALMNENESYGIQVTAARVVARIKGPESLEIILASIPKHSGALLGVLCDAATKYDDRRVIPTIIDKIDDASPSNASTPGLRALEKIKERALPEILGQVNGHPRKTVRYYLATFLGGHAYADADIVLIRTLRDDDAWVRVAAVESLRKYPGPKTVAALSKAVSDSSEDVRRRAIGSLSVLDAKASSPAIRAALNDPNPHVRRAAALAIGKIDGVAAFSLLESKLSDQEMRGSVLAAMRQLKNSITSPTLMEAIQGSNENGWNEAAMGLAELKDTRAIPVLIDKLKLDSPFYAQYALEEFGPLAADALLEYAPKSTKDRYDVVKLLGRTRNPRAFQFLMTCLESKEQSWNVIEALGNLGDIRAIPAIIPFLKSKEDLDSSCAAEALGKLNAKEAVPYLILALGSDMDYTPTNAAGALAKIGDPRAVEPLIKFLSTPVEGQWMALEYLGNFRERRVFQVLADRLKGDLELGAATRGLLLYGSKEAIPLFEQRLLDEELSDQERATLEVAIATLRKK